MSNPTIAVSTFADSHLNTHSREWWPNTDTNWVPKNGMADVRAHVAAMTNVVATRIAGFEEGSHRLRMSGSTFMLWVDHEQAYGDNNQPADGWQATGYTLYRVVGPHLLHDLVRLDDAHSSPYLTGSDGNYLPLSVAAEQIAATLIGAALRKAGV
ncbi:MAG: hypothetical protein L0H93_21065 [Nocardioides sp.]|nr:hypothetical protein [Nocardioides sp.]